MSNFSFFVLVLVSIAFAAFRFGIPAHALSPHGTYEAFAHLLVGGMVGAGLASWFRIDDREWLWLWGLSVFLSVIEIIAFLKG